MDRVGAAVVFLILLVVGGYVAVHRHNKAASAARLDALTAQVRADEAAYRESIRTAPKRLADLAACEQALPRATCERLFLALDCYEGRYECPGACDTQGNGFERWPDYEGS